MQSSPADPMRVKGVVPYSIRVPPPMVPVATTRVRPGHGHFAGLVWTLVRTDFKTRYHGTIGGFVWALLKPLTMFLVLLAVFSLRVRERRRTTSST